MFSYTPTAPGNYLIAVKYGGNYHIAGSPFKAKVTGKKLLLLMCKTFRFDHWLLPLRLCEYTCITIAYAGSQDSLCYYPKIYS